MSEKKTDAKRPSGQDQEATRPAKRARDPERARREILAAVLTGVIALPLVVVVAMALKDAVVRADEAPLRSMLGDERYEELVTEGGGGFPHYYGNERVAPDFTVPDGDGRPWSLEDQRGKVVVLNFWSKDCAPCLEELPSLELLAHMTETMDDVEVVAISTDSGPEAVASVLPQNPRVTYLYDPDKAIVQGMFGTELYPETWIIDGRGTVRFRYDGSRDWSSPLVLDLIDRFR